MAKIDAVDIPKLLFTEGAAPGTPAAAKVYLYAKSDGLLYSKDDAGVETAVSGAATGGVSSGTSFPGSPSNNDLFYRTDRDLLYFYDGTRWLTVALLRGGQSLFNGSTTTSPSIIFRETGHHNTDLWIENLYTSTFVSTTNTGSAYWTTAFKKYQNDFSTSATIVSANTSADSPSVIVTRETAVGALFVPATYKVLQVEATKTGSPGALNIACSYTYRLVG